MLFYPKMYQKKIQDINYKKLKKIGIKCLIFDLDNTIALIDQEIITDEVKDFLLKLKKDFTIIIISNNVKKRVKVYADILECDFISMAVKPIFKGTKKIIKKYNYKSNEVAVIGDQLVTDILGGNIKKYYPILVEPLAKKDLKITSLNRFLEKFIYKRYNRRNIMKKGEYYD